MPRHATEDQTVGEDSFLDTTANLVGILIILVVVIGSKTKIDAEAYGRELAAKEPTPELQEPVRELQAMQNSLLDLERKQREYDFENQFRKRERDNLLAQLTLAREAVDEHVKSLDADRRAGLEQSQRLQSLQSQLDEINQQLGAAEEQQRPPVVLEHLPTPMAKTVFSREMHIKLEHGRVTVVPWDRLIELLKQQVPLAARRQASRATLEDTLGPVGGWLMRYRMLPIPGGFELDRFELDSVSTAEDETLSEAFAPAGRLNLELASRDPAATVVTVWTYPDSFEVFRELKELLFRQGFLAAARPLPDGLHIGASPRGSRSTAQ